MSRIIEKKYSEELDIDGAYLDVQFVRVTQVETDKHYGADADGRRGTSVDFIEQDEVNDVIVDGRDLHYYDEIFRTKVDAAIWEFLKDQEVSEDEDCDSSDRPGEPEDLDNTR